LPSSSPSPNKNWTKRLPCDRSMGKLLRMFGEGIMIVNRHLKVALLGSLLALALGRCGGDDNGNGTETKDTSAVDQIAEVTDLIEDLLPTDLPGEHVDEVLPPVDLTPKPDLVELVPDIPVDPCQGSSCPTGYCDPETGNCLFCSEEQPCSQPGTWCKDSWCVTTLCIPESKDCSTMTQTRTCGADGESFTYEDCPEEQACNAGECLPVICNPGDRKCGAAGMLKVCAPTGVAWVPTSCPPGQACTAGDCRPLQHNLLVIFDTSSSMWPAMGMGTVPCICASCAPKAYPGCEDPACPRSRLGLSKHVFMKFFDSPNIGAVNLVLTHFAQKIKSPPVTACDNMWAMGRGYYSKGMTDTDFITGDDGSHVTAEGSWFDTNLHEILSVPFPVDEYEDNLGKAKLWVDFDEQVGPTETPCIGSIECPGGFCEMHEGSKVCWYHTNPELRALGGTPLGRSMFYAGELYRKQIMVDGRECETAADCKNKNYYCTTQGKCKDPYALCRVNMILLFTDGEESPETSTSEFFNPRVQAKRFRYGLGCNTDDDCFDGAVCENKMCQGYPHPNGGSSYYPPNTETPWRVERYDGVPIRIMTHVIDMSSSSGSSNNRGIANDGGGSYYIAADADPDAMLAQLLELVDLKQNLLGCVPDYSDISMEDPE